MKFKPTNPLSTGVAVLAVLAMASTPVAAAQLPEAGNAPSGAYDASAEDAYGYRYRRHRHRNRGIDAGDVIAGVVVLGAIAAIAGAASNNRDDRRRDRDDVRQREPVRQNSGWNSGGIDNAVDMCVDQIERGDTRVDDVDNASRNGTGWDISGSLNNGDRFSCRIDNDGRIRSIDIGDGYAYSGAANTSQTNARYAQAGEAGGEQLSDEEYARARAGTLYQEQSSAVDSDLADTTNDARPAYPGGPLPGEEGYDEALGG